MTQMLNKKTQIKNFQDENLEIINKIIYKLKRVYQDRRKIMYSDIINYITRKEKEGEIFNKLMIWCNYNIRLGKNFVNLS